MDEYTDTSVYYILCFPYFPVPQPVEKCIQLQLIQTEYTVRIGEYEAAFVYDSVTIRLGCIQSGPKTAPSSPGLVLHPKTVILSVLNCLDRKYP